VGGYGSGFFNWASDRRLAIVVGHDQRSDDRVLAISVFNPVSVTGPMILATIFPLWVDEGLDWWLAHAVVVGNLSPGVVEHRVEAEPGTQPRTYIGIRIMEYDGDQDRA
jgi:hypothetical protein